MRFPGLTKERGEIKTQSFEKEEIEANKLYLIYVKQCSEEPKQSYWFPPDILLDFYLPLSRHLWQVQCFLNHC